MLLRHRVGPVWNLLKELLVHDENLPPLRHGDGLIVHILKNFNHSWTHNETELSHILFLGFYEYVQIVHL